MKSRTLFTASLGVSLIVHVLVLFGPLSGSSQPSTQTERYRVTMIEKTIQDTRQKEGTATPESSSVQIAPVDEKKAVTTEAPIDKIDAEYEPANQKSEAPSVDHPQPQIHNDQELEERTAIRTSNPGQRANGWSPGAGHVLQQEESTDYQRVLSELRRRLQQSLHYPEVARRKGIEGTVAIRFTLSTEGYAEEVVVSESSGFRILDRAALRAISDSFPYPDPPETPLHFTIPVTFCLTTEK